MKVCEIFTSIQGESTRAGLMCTFIRFTGCNLMCSYCDTTYAYEEGREYSQDGILSEVSSRGVKLVEITGGEPLLQVEVLGLISGLLERGHEVMVETNGSVTIKDIDKRAIVIMDVKTPGSGESGKMAPGNLDLLKTSDEVKFVITDRADYEWATEIINEHLLFNRCSVLMSPAYGVLEPKVLSGWILEDRLGVRLNLQLHTSILGPGERAV
jgi:7-carboxy-7-deazaguanine synthase